MLLEKTKFRFKSGKFNTNNQTQRKKFSCVGMYSSKWHVGNLVLTYEIMTSKVFTDLERGNENKKEQ